MGGDGQAYSNKRKFLEESKNFVTAEELRKEEEKGTDVLPKEKVNNTQRWTHCALSLEPLEAPVVFDLRGRLYSKRVVLDNILDRRRGSTPRRDDLVITRLNDVCEVSNVKEGDKVMIRCPLTGFEAACGLHNFVGFWGCGHVLCIAWTSESLLRLKKRNELSPSQENKDVTCPYCGESSFPVSLVLDTEEDEMAQFRRLRALHRALRKRKRS